MSPLVTTGAIVAVELKRAPDGTWQVMVGREVSNPDHSQCQNAKSCSHTFYKIESSGHATLWEACDAAGKLCPSKGAGVAP